MKIKKCIWHLNGKIVLIFLSLLFCKYEQHYKYIFALKIAVHNIGSTIMETGIMEKVNALYDYGHFWGGMRQITQLLVTAVIVQTLSHTWINPSLRLKGKLNLKLHC